MQHERYMQRCLELASLGIGKVEPNPLVGSVIVHNDTIIGEGYHMQYGKAHAEVNAISSVINKELLKESTMYVNLEPCSHFGKTPPCSDLIIEKKIPRVVIGSHDPFPEVSGKGIEKLRAKGVEVLTGILNDESDFLNRRFFTFHTKKRPFIILKWAESKEGFMSSDNPADPKWMSNAFSKMLVHKWRSEEPGIMIGTNTAINDDPLLNVREWYGRNPVKIVVDRNLRIPSGAKLFQGEAKTLVFNSLESSQNGHVHKIKVNFNENVLPEILRNLFELEILSVMVEGGSVLLNSLIQANLWDEARIFKTDASFQEGLKSPSFHGHLIQQQQIQNDLLLVYQNNQVINQHG